MALPERIPCRCGDLLGDLVLKQAVVEFTDNTGKKRRVQPSEFENLGGRSAAKKWKTSIKVRGITGFDNKEIGQYLRDGLGVDINRGVFTTSVSGKPGSNSKPPASSKSAVTKLAAAVKSGANVSQAPARTSLATAKQPLEDRLRTQLGNTFVCYEVPTPSQVMLDPDATDKRIHLGRAWPDFVCQPCAGDASSNEVSQASEVTRERQHVDDVLPGEDAEKDAPAKYETPIEVLHGRPSRNSTAILDLRKASFPVLFSLSRNSGSERALSSSILSGDPQVPKGKESTVPGHTSTTNTQQ